MEKICIAGIEYADASPEEAADECFSYTEKRESRVVITPNGEIAERACEDNDFAALLQKADIAVPDGVSVILAAKRAGTPLTGRIPGVELADGILLRLNKKGGSLYLFGGGQGVAQEAASNISGSYPNIQIIGTSNGYFDDDTQIIEAVTKASPDVLFVCLGSPKQEEWMLNNRLRISCGVMLGLGGTLDVLAGRVKRAPAFWRRIGCEWLYRTVKQPSRIKRIWKIPLFVLRNGRAAKVRNQRKDADHG